VLRHRAWPFLREVVWRFNDDQGTVLAGYLAYSAMLSFMPFLIFATALTGFIVGPQEGRAALDLLFEAVPEHVARTLEPVVREVIGQRRGGILTLSALGAIWAASNGIEALRVGLDHAYDVDDSRHVALSRAIAILVVLAGFMIFVALGVLIILAPLAFRLVEAWAGIDVPAGADIARYAVAIAILWAALWMVHRFLPSRPMRGFVLWPGILASMVIWVMMATAFSIYLSYTPFYSVTYGTLAGVILTLLFFYLTGVALIFGAQVNATANARRMAATTGGSDGAPVDA
jgi:membrane protein